MLAPTLAALTLKIFYYQKKTRQNYIIRYRTIDSPFNVQREVEVLNDKLRDCPYVIRYFEDFRHPINAEHPQFRCIVLEYSEVTKKKLYHYIVFNISPEKFTFSFIYSLTVWKFKRLLER
jgi:hypothetical protein